MEGPSLSDIEKELQEITDYYKLGVHLGIEEEELKQIEADSCTNDRRKLGVIGYWQRNFSDRSWEALANAVEKMRGHANLVKKLRMLGTTGQNDSIPDASHISEQDAHMEAVKNNDDASVPAQLQLSLADRLNERPTKKELRDHVQKKIGDKWEEVAIELGLDDQEVEDDDARTKLDEIRDRRKDKPTLAAHDVLTSWLNDKRIRRTWGILIDALREVGLQELVESVNTFLSTSSQNSVVSATTPAATAAQQSTSQTSTEQNLEAMDVSTSQESAISLSSSQSSHSSRTKRYEIRLKPREYQKELARSGMCGQNYIICAPTNSGKTLVAAMVIANHLEKKSQMQQKPKVVFVVKTRTLADQQTQQLSEYIHDAGVVCRTGNRGDIREHLLQLHIKDALHSSDTDVIVCTAGKLLDEIKKEDVSLQEFSLMIIDECHNTEYSRENSNNAFAQIMQKYLELTDPEVVAKGQQPQVVGLTATPGVGKNPGLDSTKAIDNLIMLCAHMDATGGIQTVQEHKKELDQYIQKPESHLDTVDQCKRKELQRIEQEMLECERFLNFSGPLPRWSQQYEQAVKTRKIALEESDDKNDRDKVTTVRLLEHYSRTMIKYMELPCAQATDYLNEYEDLIESDKLSVHEEHLLEKFTQLKDDIKSLDISENPVLKKLELRLTDVFQQKRQSSGIVFVRTREQAEAICNWISTSKLAEKVGIKAKMLVGHKNLGGKGPVMFDEDQKWVVAAFREGACNLLIATSVAEEGLDIKQCNLVIRLHISGARAKEQMKGRARAADSEIVTIVSYEQKKLYKDMLNDELVRLMNQLIQSNSLPSPQQLQKEIIRRQQVIRQNVKKQKMLEKLCKDSHPAQDVELKCNRCKITACRGSDIYCIDKTNHHVVPGNEFSALYVQVDHHITGILDGCSDPIVEKLYKIHCAKCNQPWGVMGTWPSGMEFPVLKCEYFNFYVNGKPKNFRKWKNRPFNVFPLSEWFTPNSPLATTD